MTDGIPPFVMGGMQKHSKFVCESLASLEYNVLLYHFIEGKNLPTDEEVLIQFPKESREFIQVRTFSYSDNSRIPGHYLRAQSELSKRYLAQLILEQEPIDFIYTKGFVGYELLKNRPSKFKLTPIGVKFHGMNMFQKQPNLIGELIKYMFRNRVRRTMNRADYVFSYGGKISEIILEQLEDSRKLIELTAGVSADWVREDVPAGGFSKIKFLFVGRFDRLKGLPELYKAIKRIKRTDWSLTIVGPIPHSHRISHHSVAYEGMVNEPNRLKEIYDQHHVLLCPSISEGMPNVILEAMSRGMAVIATDVGASSVLVNEKTGWLIAPSDVTGLVEAILDALSTSHEDLWRKRVEAKALIQNQFLWSSIGKRLEEKLNSIIDENDVHGSSSNLV
jgi:glycosyltransferase involved in cell wall biosynthesis